MLKKTFGGQNMPKPCFFEGFGCRMKDESKENQELFKDLNFAVGKGHETPNFASFNSSNAQQNNNNTFQTFPSSKQPSLSDPSQPQRPSALPVTSSAAQMPLMLIMAMRPLFSSCKTEDSCVSCVAFALVWFAFRSAGLVGYSKEKVSLPILRQ